MEVYTVSNLTKRIRNLLEFEIGAVWVEGEISNLRKQASGHQYFTLKDAHAQISCAFFKGQARFNRVPLQDGSRMRVFGELTLYEARGQYQLVVKQLQPLGTGSLHERFETLKAKLREEGLFDEARKRPLPSFPLRVGIITSPTGAVLQDMIHVFERRAPWLELFVCPVRVQGTGAFREIIAALRRFDQGRPAVDAIVLARGGGSLEDLWNFNEEALAREMVSCSIPIVSAVGHETDFSICDFVADARAPTPSAAAEILTPDRADLLRKLQACRLQLDQITRRRMTYLDERLAWFGRSAGVQAPRRRLRDWAQQLDDLQTQMDASAAKQLQRWEHQLAHHANSLRHLAPGVRFRRQEDRLQQCETTLKQSVRRRLSEFDHRLHGLDRQLHALSPEHTLARGYSIVTKKDGTLVTSPDQAPARTRLTIRTRGGDIDATARSRRPSDPKRSEQEEREITEG